jgi:hypothetical protein
LIISAPIPPFLQEKKFDMTLEINYVTEFIIISLVTV